MAWVYYKKITRPGSTFTIDDVPEQWRAAVQALLDADL